MAVGEDLRQTRRQRFDDCDVRHALLVRSQGQRLADHLIQVDHRARRLALAREGQQVADDARGAFGFGKDRFEAAAERRVEPGSIRQPLGPAEDGRERVVQFVRDAGNRLAERRHLFGLQQLVIEVAGFVIELLALADVPHQRFDAHHPVALRRVRPRRELDPDGVAVGAAQTQQIVVDGSIRRQPLEKAGARMRVDEAIEIERAHVLFGGVARVPEDQLEMRIGGDRRRRTGTDRADVDALMDRLEQSCECGCAAVHSNCGMRIADCPITSLPAAQESESNSETTASTSSRSRRESPPPKLPKRASASRHARRRGTPLMSSRAVPTPSRRPSRHAR